MQDICAQLTGGVHLPSIYRHCPRSSSGCSGMQGICAQLTWEDLCCMAFCYSNIFGVVVFNAHMLDWLGVYLTSIYRHCPRSSSGCSNMQGICAWLTGEGHMKCNGIQGIYAWLTGGVHLPSIYMHCTRSNSGCNSMQDICALFTGEHLCWIALCHANIFGVAVFNASMLGWIGGSICLLYTCIVLDLIVGVMVCKTSVLYWLGRTYATLHCGMLIYLV